MVDKDPVLAAVIGGMDPQQAIVSGGGPTLSDANGVPWNGRLSRRLAFSTTATAVSGDSLDSISRAATSAAIERPM